MTTPAGRKPKPCWRFMASGRGRILKFLSPDASLLISSEVAFLSPRQWYLVTMFAALLPVLLLALSQPATASTTFESQCLAFAPEKYVDGATRNVLAFVPAGTNVQFPDNDATCSRANQTASVDLCRIALSIKTTSTSSIIFEAWLPSVWSGRFLATGNGGIDGCES